MNSIIQDQPKSYTPDSYTQSHILQSHDRTIAIQGVEWDRSQFFYTKELVSKDEHVMQFRRASFGSSRLKLDNLILEVLDLIGEADTGTVARALVMNQKSMHRRLARLHFQGCVSMRKERQYFFWSKKEDKASQ